jgi:hypothetical protein
MSCPRAAAPGPKRYCFVFVSETTSAKYDFFVMRARLRAAALAILVATAVAVCSAGVARADECGGFGPGIFGPNNCGPPDNTGGDPSSDFSSWPPGVGWGSGGDGGDDNSPIILPSP